MKTKLMFSLDLFYKIDYKLIFIDSTEAVEEIKQQLININEDGRLFFKDKKNNIFLLKKINDLAFSDLQQITLDEAAKKLYENVKKTCEKICYL